MVPYLHGREFNGIFEEIAMKKFITIIIITASLQSCCNGYKQITEDTYLKYMEELGLLIPGIDTLNTEEAITRIEQLTQSDNYKKIMEIAANKCIIQGDTLVLTAGRKYFIRKGLPSKAYDAFMYSIITTNKSLRSSGIDYDLASAMKSLKEEYN